MVRTRSFGVKAGGKSSKKAASSAGPASSASSSSASKKSEAGNAVQAQPTPAWQREITGFLGNPSKKPRLEDDVCDANETEKKVEVGAKEPSKEAAHEPAKEPAEQDNTAESNVEEDTDSGSNSTNEKKASAEVKVLSLEKENKIDEPSKKENGSVGNSNGCKVVDENVPVSNEAEKNGSVLPVLAQGNDNV